jgi:hypothetical protein
MLNLRRRPGVRFWVTTSPVSRRRARTRYTADRLRPRRSEISLALRPESCNRIITSFSGTGMKGWVPIGTGVLEFADKVNLVLNLASTVLLLPSVNGSTGNRVVIVGVVVSAGAQWRELSSWEGASRRASLLRAGAGSHCIQDSRSIQNLEICRLLRTLPAMATHRGGWNFFSNNTETAVFVFGSATEKSQIFHKMPL